jgi:C4-dicarboxylate transporter
MQDRANWFETTPFVVQEYVEYKYTIRVLVCYIITTTIGAILWYKYYEKKRLSNKL